MVAHKSLWFIHGMLEDGMIDKDNILIKTMNMQESYILLNVCFGLIRKGQTDVYIVIVGVDACQR